MNETYYLKTGEQCELVEDLRDGRYLIRKHISGSYLGFDTLEDCYADIICVDMIYDKPPTYIYNEEIVKLKKEIEELQKVEEGLKSVILQYMSNIVNRDKV